MPSRGVEPHDPHHAPVHHPDHDRRRGARSASSSCAPSARWPYDDDLREDIDADIIASASTFVGLAVTEIATLRGELAGRQQG